MPLMMPAVLDTDGDGLPNYAEDVNETVFRI